MTEEKGIARRPPHNEEAERAVLGGLLLAPDRIPEIAEIINPDSFYSKRHRVLFEALVSISNKGLPVDFLTVGQVLESQGKFEAFGGNEYLIQVSDAVTTTAHLAHHARIVQQESTRRRLIEEATTIVEEAHQTRPDPDSMRALLDESENRIFQVARQGSTDQADPIRNVLVETFKRIESQAQRRGLTGLTSGFTELDRILFGFNAGDLVVLAARPSMGKTALALNIIESAAFSQPEGLGRPPSILFFSLEMGRQQIASRMLFSRARVDQFRMRTGNIPDHDFPALSEAAGELNLTNIFIDDSPGLSAMTLRGRARRIKAQIGLDMVVVDYLQLMSHPRSESRQIEISAISRSLKALARELNVPVIALSQLSRQVELREDKIPQLSDLRESGSIEQDADIVLLLHRPEYYKRDDPELKNKAFVIVAKHRNGPTGEVQLHFFSEYTRFENPALTISEPILG
ncbi:MAG: replicative DNA helicase [Planctomycetes bacterium]|nr:replicative DNA helicase [Planctomycetota bacterium]